MSMLLGIIAGGRPWPPANSASSLLHFDGADASTTFTDESGKTWTGNGNAQLDTAQFQFGTSSLLLDAVGDYLTTPSSTDFSVTGSFTVECWVRRTATGRDAISSKYTGAGDGILFDIGPSDELRLIMGTGSFITCSSGATTIPTNTWTHVAGVKDGSTLRVFVNGTQAATLPVTGTPANNSSPLYLGRDPLDTSRDFGGWIDEFRFSNVARYTANFTPPVAPFSYPG